MKDILHQLTNNLKESKVYCDEPMYLHTSFRVGGKADIFVDVGTAEIPVVVEIAKENALPVTVIGNGTNLLVGDGGIRGITICIGSNASKIGLDGKSVFAEAGALLSSVSKTAANNSLTGLEFAAGIPGSIGGAVVMNAGAYDGSMSEYIDKVAYIDMESGESKEIDGSDCKFSYRHSIFLESRKIVSGVSLLLETGDKDSIFEKMQELNNKRKKSQPLEYPSAGSTFKRPLGHFAGKLIMDAGLKGMTIGDACISTKHAGFIVNKGKATANDIKSLMDEVVAIVEKEFEVVLEPEVRLVGEFY